jgi:hypothetical protein
VNLRMSSLVILLAAWFHGSLSFAQNDKSDEPRAFDSTQTMLATIYKGDLKRTQQTMSELAKNYQKFLDHFIATSNCAGMAPEIREGCKKIRAKERDLIARHVWSQDFSLGGSDFNQSYGVYNLIKSQQISGDFRCVFTLQLTADLNLQSIVNDEFLASCKQK